MPSAVTRALRNPRSEGRRLLRRHRRPAAAILAGLGALVALTALRTPAEPPGPAAGDNASPSTLRVGEVLVPVALTSAATATALHVGDVVDLVGFAGEDQVTATVVAPRARVVELPEVGSVLSGPTSGIVLVAVPASDSLPLSAASADGGLSVVIRSR